MKRIFAAIDISDDARAKAAEYIENLRGEFPKIRVGWEKAEKLHLTLKFFGDVNEKQLAKLSVAVEETAKQLSNFKLQIAGTGVFPSKRKRLFRSTADSARNWRRCVWQCQSA